MVQAISWMWLEATATLPSQMMCVFIYLFWAVDGAWVLFYCEPNEPKFPFEMSGVFMQREAMNYSCEEHMNLQMNFLIITSKT